MSAVPSLRPLVGYLQQLAAQTVCSEASDRQLLERFARERDDEAFRLLVRRHGPLVLGVCRRALRHRQDAEDCFQATFLVLARKAGAIRWRDSIAGWLHEAATRLAAAIRFREARRRRRELHAAAQRATVPQAARVSDVAALLDDELRGLPEAYRTPLVLCCLDGQTRDQAAVQLGLSLRTLERRLQTGRALLRARLARRGLTLSAGLIAWDLVQASGRAAPADLCAAVTQAAAPFAAGDLANVPARAGSLATQFLRALVWDRLRAAAVLVLFASVLGLGAALWATAPADRPPEPVIAVAASDEPRLKPKAHGKLQEAGTAAAVQEGLRWLVRQQAPDGSWQLDTTKNEAAATAFGLLPLLAAAEDAAPAQRFGEHANAVRRGLANLARIQQADGALPGGMYAHALATWALCDGYRLTGDAKLKQPAERALAYIVAAQHAGGGWRYAPKQAGDTSVTTWQVIALNRGLQAGLDVSALALRNAAKYLDSAASDGSAGYGYVPGSPVSPSMTAAGLMCRHLLGWEARDPRMLKGAARLQAMPPAPTVANCYYYHFATRVMHTVGGEEWEAWESPMARMLLDRQQRDGSDRGSWPAGRDLYAPAGGRLMITSLSLLTLQSCGRLTLPVAGAHPKLKQDEAVGYWDDLAASDFARVKRAIERLAADPTQSVALLRQRVQPAVPPAAKRLAQLIDALGSDDFDTRDRAFRELAAVGEPAESVLRRAFNAGGSLELRRRLERLLDDIDRTAVAPAWLRQLRALQILELAGTGDARQLLQTLADGAPGARLTRAAQAALVRLGKAPG